MKLYATVTSERATKGQGGNERLTIHITGEDRGNDIGVITVFPWRNTLEDGIPHICANIRDDIGFSVDRFTKGKKQKGERYCTSCGNVEAQKGKHCADCGKLLIYKI